MVHSRVKYEGSSLRDSEIEYFFNLDLEICEEIWIFLRNTRSEFDLVDIPLFQR